MIPKTSTVLAEAREIIADESRWTQGVDARRCDGTRAPSAVDPSACKWCAWGAIQLACRRLEHPFPNDIYQVLSESLSSHGSPYTAPARVNDTLGHEAAIAMFDAGITYAEQKGL